MRIKKAYSKITIAEIIQRGYEDVVTRLSSIGAEISEKIDQQADK